MKMDAANAPSEALSEVGALRLEMLDKSTWFAWSMIFFHSLEDHGRVVMLSLSEKILEVGVRVVILLVPRVCSFNSIFSILGCWVLDTVVFGLPSVFCWEVQLVLSKVKKPTTNNVLVFMFVIFVSFWTIGVCLKGNEKYNNWIIYLNYIGNVLNVVKSNQLIIINVICFCVRMYLYYCGKR